MTHYRITCRGTRTWKQTIDIKDPSMEYWLKGAGRSNSERFIFDPITVGLNLFNSKPTITFMKNEIRKMKSYIPSMVAMKVFDNPTQENRILRDYVNNYVNRFSF
ncbi:hypothetical protein SAMN05661091_3215 [Paenibacillus uliginis N3/975]|uniref:Uncharacterized protein n=1 Tax=Paenibacillus uliginis N3/975 TaxID=1313296 RepID=A0A1X7HHQ0_9BACL|nr:hypothetical protein SAMN05661091_3215 [Paenibacillus uliginis N3/975]